MGNDRRDPMSAEAKNYITDAFKMKKRLSSCLNLKHIEKIGVVAQTAKRVPSPVSEICLDQPESTTSLKRGVKTSPAYLRNDKKTRLSQKKSARGVTPVRSKPAQSSGELRRSPRGVLQCTPNGPKRCLAPQESPQEISWEGQSPKYRQRLKSGLDKGIAVHTKNVMEIINVLKTDKIPLEKTEENPVLDLWVLAKPSAQQYSSAAAETRRGAAKKLLKNPRRVCDELVQLMKIAKDTSDNNASPTKKSELQGENEKSSTALCDSDNLWDDDSFFNDDSFIRQTQITETEYLSQQASAAKLSKNNQTPNSRCVGVEPAKQSLVSNVPPCASSVKSRYTFRSSIPKSKCSGLTPTDNHFNSSKVKFKDTLTPERTKMLSEMFEFGTVTQRTSQYQSTLDEILCPETQVTNASLEVVSGSDGSSVKLSAVRETQAISCKHNYHFSSSVTPTLNPTCVNYLHSTCSQEEARVQSQQGMCTQGSVNNSLPGRNIMNLTSRSFPTRHCGTEKTRSEHLASKTKQPTVLDEDLSSMLDDDFVLEPDVLELVEAAENTYLAACQPASQPSSQIQCTQEEILKKREAALQRRRKKSGLKTLV